MLPPFPANARHFGDFADPNSAVSIMTMERGGMDLMPEMDTKPVNKYLPPRPKSHPEQAPELAPAFAPKAGEGLLGWIDRALEKLG